MQNRNYNNTDFKINVFTKIHYIAKQAPKKRRNMTKIKYDLKKKKTQNIEIYEYVIIKIVLLYRFIQFML